MSADSTVTLVSDKNGRARMIGTSRYMKSLSQLAKAMGLGVVLVNDRRPADRIDRLELTGSNDQFRQFYRKLIEATEGVTPKEKV